MSELWYKAGQYNPVDIEIKGSCCVENPYYADVTGSFQGPCGKSISVPGFYDGDGIWKVRFSPLSTGLWKYTISSPHILIEQPYGYIQCIENENVNIHGGLEINPENPYHFEYEDGTKYFLLGYECNWLWALGFDDKNVQKVKEFIKQIKSYSFNHIFINLYAHDTSWCNGVTSIKDYGPPKHYLWEGTNENPEFGYLNMAFFRNLDRVVKCLMEEGIIAHLYFKAYNKKVNWPLKYSVEEELYFKYIASRYQAFSNIVWDFSKEAFHETDKEYIKSRINLVKECDAYHRLFTIHDDRYYSSNEKYNESIDFITLQQHSDFYTSILLERQKRKWPVLNAEFGYEPGPLGSDDLTYQVGHSPEEIIRRAYHIVMAGGYPGYYYTYTAWDVIDYSYIPKGYAYLKILYDIFTSVNWWEFEPHPEVCCWHGKCLARLEKEYLAYFEANETCVLNLWTKNTKFKTIWINAFTGEKLDENLVKPKVHPDSPQLYIFRSPFDNAPGILHILME